MNGNSAIINNSIFKNNIGINGGGAFYTNCPNLYVNNCLFDNNT